jgi:hypothetical protein
MRKIRSQTRCLLWSALEKSNMGKFSECHSGEYPKRLTVSHELVLPFFVSQLRGNSHMQNGKKTVHLSNDLFSKPLSRITETHAFLHI